MKKIHRMAAISLATTMAVGLAGSPVTAMGATKRAKPSVSQQAEATKVLRGAVDGVLARARSAAKANHEKLSVSYLVAAAHNDVMALEVVLTTTGNSLTLQAKSAPSVKMTITVSRNGTATIKA